MSTLTQRVAWRTVAGFCAMLALQVTAVEKPFTGDDLKPFLAESVPFLEWVRTNHQERVLDRLLRQHGMEVVSADATTAELSIPSAYVFINGTR